MTDSKLIHPAFSIFFYLIILIICASSEASALSAKTDLGPNLSFISNHTYLFHIGHHTDNHAREVRGTGGSRDRCRSPQNRSRFFDRIFCKNIPNQESGQQKALD